MARQRRKAPFDLKAGVEKLARQAAAVLVDALTGAPPAGELPADNRITTVELTLVGIEGGVRVSPAVLAEQLVAYLRSIGAGGDPTVLVLDTRVVGEYAVVLQFRLDLDWPADRAQYECETQCGNLMNGRDVLAYGVRVMGVK